MTICNMSIEGGARAGLVAPDDTTYQYLAEREFAPKGKDWDDAVARWKQLPTDEGATYAEKITPADRELDLARPARELVNRVRALSPHIGARAVVEGVPLVVWRAREADDGSLELLEVQPEGRRRMTYAEYLRGRR